MVSGKPGEKWGFSWGLDAVSGVGIIVGVGCHGGGIEDGMCRGCFGENSEEMMGIIERRR